MSVSKRIPAVSFERVLWIGAALALGLYAGRFCAELLRPGMAIGLVLTLVAIAASMLILRGRTDSRSWPLLILFIYVFYPEPDPRIALSVGLAAAIALLQATNALDQMLPFRRRTVDILSASLLVLGFLTLYVNTLSHDVLPADAGELQLVAAEWGVAHPTGFPLYTILANLATKVPIGPGPAYRTNLLSALTSTATLLLLYIVVYRLSRRRLAGILAAAALGTSTTFWSQATTANTRSLTAMFTVAALYLLLVLRDQQSRSSNELADGGARRSDPLWLQALFVWLLVSAILHHSSLIFIGSLLAIYAIMVQPSFVKEPRRWPVLLLASLIAFLPLLYLPLRGAAGAVGAPEDLETIAGFLNHVLGLGFRGDLFFFDRLSVLWARLLVMVNVLTFQFSPFLLLVTLLGLILLFQADRLLGTVLAASMLIHTVVAAVYRAPQTVEYMLPVYVLLGVTFGYAAGRLRDFQLRSFEGPLAIRALNVVAILLVTAMVMAVLVQAVHNFGSFRELSNDETARDYALPLLQDAPPDTIILADWHWATPLWYLKEVEGVRPDVDVQFVFPESGLYADTWAGQIATELASGRPVIATHYDPVAYGQLPFAEPIHEAFLFRQKPIMQAPNDYAPIAVEIGPDMFAEGYRLEAEEIMPGQELAVLLAWRAKNEVEPRRRLYAHLIGPDGQLYAGDDQLAQSSQQGLNVSRFQLTPLLQTPPGTYELVIGSYDATESDVGYAAPLAQIEVATTDSPPITENRVFRPLVGATDERTLIGYDWDSTLPGKQRLYLHWSTNDGYETQIVDVDGGQFTMPNWYGPWGIEIEESSFALEKQSAYIPFGQGLVWLGQDLNERQPFVPGERVKLAQEFTAARPVLRDLVVSLRLVGYQEDGQSWAWWDLDDGVPAMGAIPTLKWIAGSRVDHPVYSTVSPDARPNQESEPLLLLYDAFTTRQLPILDERITQLAPWVPLGRVSLTAD